MFVLEPWEQDEKEDYMRLYRDEEYETICNLYCHEGLKIYATNKGCYKGGVCSVQESASTREELIKKVAQKIMELVKEDKLGC